jgi:hypothetical protein
MMTQQNPNFAQSLIGGFQQGQQAQFQRQFQPLQLQQAQLGVEQLQSQQNIQNTIRNLTALEGQIGAGMGEGQILQNLQAQREEILSRGGNPADTDQAIQALQSGGMAGLNQLLQAGRTEFERAGLLTPIDTGPSELEQKMLLEQFKANLAAGGKGTERADTLRGEVVKAGKELQFPSVVSAFDRIKASSEDPSAAGDLSLIFNYMKMLDPGSVVRESEFATAQNSAGVPDRIRNMYNRVLSGERLGTEQRNDFVDRANRLFVKAETRFKNRIKPILSLGKADNLTEQDILGEGFFEAFKADEIALPSSIPAQQAPQVNPAESLSDEELLKLLGQ